MTKEDIKVGQTYKWHRTSDKDFTIIAFDGKFISWRVNLDGNEIHRYNYGGLIRSVNKGSAYLVSDARIQYKMDRFKFV